MKRIFSGNRSGASSPNLADNRSRSNSIPPQPTEEIPPELAPIVTLLGAQAHRRYNEGIFMLLQSINSDGEPAPNRQWREVYGVLLGTQLAVWSVDELERHQNNTEALMNASSKPDYINFTDSSFRAVDKLENSQGLRNIIIVSTTLKNQYLLQFQEQEDFHRWNAAFRLSTFEYTSLQEAYTGALLSAKGSKLSDIRTILAESKFDYGDWVSVRFGSGMPWKRCFAVIEQPSKKSKKGKIHKGSVSFYKDEKKQKKTAMAVIKDASATYALYPQSHKLIDHSTMIKLEGTVFFDGNKKSLPKEASVYFMPEQHSAVPGYDTLIRFLIPLLDTFALYGRPKRLNANKGELNSLLFGLPVLPHVHYLDVDDLILLASSPQSGNWLLTEWRLKIKEVLGRKLANGYTGCGSNHGVMGAISSPAFNSNEFLDVRSINSGNNRPISPLSPSFFPAPKFNRDSMISKNSSLNESGGEVSEPSSPPKVNRNSEITQIYEDYSNVAQMGNSGSGNSAVMGRYNKSNEHVSQRNKQYGNGIGYGTSDRLQDPYATSRSQQSTSGNLDPQSSSTKGNSDPYSNFKSSSSQGNNYLDDDDFNDDFNEDFNKGISALSVDDKPSRSDDVFNPDYHGIDDSAEVSRAKNEPALQVQTPSKPLPLPNIKIEQASPYTSGRINSSSPTTAHAPQFKPNLPKKDSFNEQPQSNQYSYDNRGGASQASTQQATTLETKNAPLPPQHQASSSYYQQQPTPQRSQYPPQQQSGAPSQRQDYGYPPQQQNYQQPHQHQRPPPQQQQQQQQAPQAQQQRLGGNPPQQQQRPQQYSQQGFPPQQQQQYQQRPPPQQQGYPSQQPQQRRGPPPPQQQHQHGYPPQGYSNPAQPSYGGYPPQQQQQYARGSGYPAPQQQPIQSRQIPNASSSNQISRAQYEYGSNQSLPVHQQQQQRAAGGASGYPQRKPVNPYAANAGPGVGGTGAAPASSNPYAQGNPYAR